MSADESLTDDELAACRGHVGHRVEETEIISPDVVSRYAAALDANSPDPGDPLPPLWHYGFFLSKAATASLGEDGHPPRGGFMPAIRLARRMFAGAEVTFLNPLVVGREAVRISEIVSVEQRLGKSGALVFVRVKITIAQQGTRCIEEMQAIVYRGAGAPIAPVIPAAARSLPPDHIVEDWLPGRVELFRFSAVTFNAHRIHYDLPYAKEIEGYPDLVVHGPLTAMRLCALAQRVAGRPLTRFSFRGEAPLFVDQAVRLIAKADGAGWQIDAERCDGVRAMTAGAACR